MTQNPATSRLKKWWDSPGGSCKASATSHSPGCPGILCQRLSNAAFSFSASILRCRRKLMTLYADVCRRQWAYLKTCRKLEDAGAYPLLGEFVPDGKNTLGLIVSLMASLEFRVTSLLLVITAQINPLHPVQIIAMSRGEGEACCGYGLYQAVGKCGGQLQEVPVAQLQACGPLCPPCWGRGSVSARLSCSF